MAADVYQCVFTVGSSAIYVSMIMMAVSVGFAEWVYGTLRAALLFWVGHIVAILIVSLVISVPVHVVDHSRGMLLVTAYDVGPSAGYYCCLGAAVVAVSSRWKRLLVGFMLAVLLGRAIVSFVNVPEQGRSMAADAAHIAAFLFGMAAARLLRLPESQ
jgi:hypothetical protein